MGIVYFDTETTSTNPGQICELSIIHENEQRQVDFAKNYFFKVDSMTEGAQAVHGYSIESLELLSNGLTFKDYYNELLPIFSENILVAHNVAFDEKFISSEFWRCGISFKPIGRTDTMEYFKNILKIPAKYKKYGPYKNPKLSEVLEYFKVNTYAVQKYCNELFGGEMKTFHDSRFDTTAMYVVVNLQREAVNGETTWHRKFCLEG